MVPSAGASSQPRGRLCLGRSKNGPILHGGAFLGRGSVGDGHHEARAAPCQAVSGDASRPMAAGASAASCIAARAATCFRVASSFGAAESCKQETFSQSDEPSDGREPSLDGARADDLERTNLSPDRGRRRAFEADAREDPRDRSGVIGSAWQDVAWRDDENTFARQTPKPATFDGDKDGGTARL
jgi:hypothetical protein